MRAYTEKFMRQRAQSFQLRALAEVDVAVVCIRILESSRNSKLHGVCEVVTVSFRRGAGYSLRISNGAALDPDVGKV